MSFLSPTVVVAASYPPLGRFIASALRVEGYRPIVLQDGNRALEHLLKEPFDVAMLDTELASIDGFTICQRVRAITSSPVALLVMPGDTSYQTRGRQVGANALLFLPFGMDELLSCVNMLLLT
jgi:DNA-binding response OmpR family regulator